MINLNQMHNQLIATLLKDSGMPADIKGGRVEVKFRNRKCYTTEVAIALDDLIEENLISLTQLNNGVSVSVN